MPKMMQKIVLFIEPFVDSWCTPSKIGHLFMNRFAANEDAGFEILKVLELGKTSLKMFYPSHPEYRNLENERQEKGMDLFEASSEKMLPQLVVQVRGRLVTTVRLEWLQEKQNEPDEWCPL